MSTPKLKVIIGDSPANCMIYIDEEPIGLVQNIKVEVGVNDNLPKIEIVFPDLFDERYVNCNGSLTKSLAYTIERLKKIPNVSIILKSLYDANTEQTT